MCVCNYVCVRVCVYVHVCVCVFFPTPLTPCCVRRRALQQLRCRPSMRLILTSAVANDGLITPDYP